MPAQVRTNKNNPRVMMVIGKVSKNAIGLTNPLMSPSRIAAKIKVPVPDICTPGKTAEAMYKPSIAINVRKSIPFIRAIMRGSQLR